MRQILRQGTMILIAIGILIAVFVFNHFRIEAQNNRPMPERMAAVQHPDVAVITVMPEKYEAEVTSYGAANPHYALTLSAQVSGQVDKVNSRFEPGERIAKNDVLVELENSDYLAAVATAENDLASAKLASLEEERQVVQAETEWQASGLEGEPESELVLRQPQLKAAQAAVKQAEAALQSARKDLQRSKVVSPFDAVVVERDISPGAYVQAGTEIATLYSTDYVEVAVELSARDWNNLPDTKVLSRGDWPVELSSVENQQTWSGRVLRVEQHLDDSTRQRALIIAVDQAFDQNPALYPGTFLKVRVKGRMLDKLWQLPSSALSQRGEIWYVTNENTLANFVAEPVFANSQYIYINVPETLVIATQKVLVHPLSSYLQGMLVNPVEQGSNDGQ